MDSTVATYVPCHYFKRSFTTSRAKAGLEDVHLLDLRHTAASHLLMAGVDIRTLAEILGQRPCRWFIVILICSMITN